MTGLAFVANERVKLDAHGAKAKALLGSAIGTDCVRFYLGQSFHLVFCGSHGVSVSVAVGC